MFVSKSEWWHHDKTAVSSLSIQNMLSSAHPPPAFPPPSIPLSFTVVSSTGLVFIRTMRQHICLLLLLTTPPESLWALEKQCREWLQNSKSLTLHPLMRESTWQRESKLICVWNGNANSLSPTLWMRAQGPSTRCKPHLLCVSSMCKMAKACQTATVSTRI